MRGCHRCDRIFGLPSGRALGCPTRRGAGLLPQPVQYNGRTRREAGGGLFIPRHRGLSRQHTQAAGPGDRPSETKTGPGPRHIPHPLPERHAHRPQRLADDRQTPGLRPKVPVQRDEEHDRPREGCIRAPQPGRRRRPGGARR